MAVIQFWLAHRAEVLALLGQHLLLAGVATLVATAIGVPLGIAAAHRPRLGAPLVGLANVVQTIPSLAMFGFLLPLPVLGGIGPRTAIVALTLYALLPIVRTTITGITGIDRTVRDAGIALGMTPRQLLWQVELPLAVPAIVSGVRIAAVVAVGAATIAAAVGAGGLGEYIYRGLAMVDTTVILAGAIPAALLALVVDGALWLAQWRLQRRERRRMRRRTLIVGGVLLVLGLAAWAIVASRAGAEIVVGSKNFGEQLVLGEIVAQALEREGLRVRRQLNLGGTLICDRALLAGDIDVYVEYTGTALTAVFNKPIGASRDAVTATVREAYARTGRTLLAPLGFDNTFAMLVRGADARARGLRTIEDAARESPRWRAAFGYEFLDRPDGFTGLARAYGITLAEPPRAMDLSLTYRALAAGQADLIAGDATSGLIRALDLVALEDTRHYFPPYDAVPVARADTLLREPRMRAALDRLAGRITAAHMREMNYRAEALRQPPADVARDFLAGRIAVP
ncbi:glycine betaine/L-proline ABC transporter permease/substrate-binding protein [Luteitalea sp. TBR-22]|uniref:ABC transporter permease/substrate-binding protein n=1 Tax=Luteitalea sp. TBR-22 TaxID=2802971 RepID=UPI001AF4037E|nr:ABC transporter permease/substrate-binding protein [Luteitalea sp. TBR-22]BCS31930.1 glycine betaine/L-proline ABC transporter permease/substrate-binding protein [Luteitalea sp. TBR-22]